jgi:hypothetical protein
VEDEIENKFVAVFNVENPHIVDPDFCIGNLKGHLSKIEFTSYTDEALKIELADFLGINAEHVWRTNHYKLDNRIISTVSADTTAYIIQTAENSHKTLYKSDYSETIYGLTVVTSSINGQPIFLTSCGMPDTDMTWSSVLIFNGEEYEVNSDSRIRIE